MVKIEWNTYHTKGVKTQFLYRFMKVKWMLEFLRTGNMSMARMNTFEDKFEGIATGNIVSMNLLSLLKKDIVWHSRLTLAQIEHSKRNAQFHINRAREQLNGIQQCNYVCCWFLANRESVAMWDLYAGPEGLAIKFIRKELQNRVKERVTKNILPPHAVRIVAGKIVYHDFREVPKDQKKHLMKYLSFRKDASFRHENEYRFVLTLNQPCDDLDRFNYSLGDIFEGLEFKIIASPRMTDAQFANTEGKLKAINPKLVLHESELRPWFRFMEMIES